MVLHAGQEGTRPTANVYVAPNGDNANPAPATSPGSPPAMAPGKGNLGGDPLLMRPTWGETGDYHLQEGSPAIDAGSAEGAPTVDLENRPRDAQPDVGAYEFWRASSWLYLPMVVYARIV